MLEIAIAIIRHPSSGKILITRRRDNVHLGGLWEFPGGKCLPGEDLTDCAVRETREETGLAVEVLEAWPPIAFAYPERSVTLHPFLCLASLGEACPLESKELAWVQPLMLANYSFPPANAALLARLLEEEDLSGAEVTSDAAQEGDRPVRGENTHIRRSR